MINNAILLDIATPITTQNLRIRPVMPGDSQLMFDAISETYDQLSNWFSWARDINNVSDIEVTCRKFYAEFIKRDNLHFLAFKEDTLIGGCSLHNFNLKIPSSDIGYWIRYSQQNNGYATEMIIALTKLGFETIGLKRISSLHDEENTPSIKAVEKAGFSLEVKTKGLYKKPGDDGLRDNRRYVLFNN